MTREALCRAAARALPWLTAAWVAVMLLSLARGTLDPFFWPASRGIDYWCVPRGFLNLLAGRSMYDTFGGVAFGGPRVTWYLAHPVFELVVAPWFSFADASTSYWLWTLCTLGLLASMGWMFARRARTPLGRRACWFLALFGFPVYGLLFVGNLHAWVVLSLGMTLAGCFDMCRSDGGGGRGLLAAGLLVGLFSKPVLVLALPMLALVKETRRTTLAVVAAYALVSSACVLVPSINPEGVGLARLAELVADPAWVRAHMNVYANRFVLNREMKDTAIHWLNLVAQSEFLWDHVQIYSLSAFVNNALDRELPAWLFKLPLVVAVVLSLAVAWVPDPVMRLDAVTLALALVSLTFFLSYHTVWEYHYASLAPLGILGVLLLDRGERPELGAALAGAAVVAGLPSLYVLFGPDVQVPQFVWVRLTRVVPAVVAYVAVLAALVRALAAGRQRVER